MPLPPNPTPDVAVDLPEAWLGLWKRLGFITLNQGDQRGSPGKSGSQRSAGFRCRPGL